MGRHGRASGKAGQKQRPRTLKRRNAPKTGSHKSFPAASKETGSARLIRERDEARDQQTATAEILRVIRNSPADAQPVFETIVRNAVALCGSLFANVFRFDGELLHYVASHNVGPSYVGMLQRIYPRRPDLSQISGRVILTKSVVRMEDALSDPEYDKRFLGVMRWRRALGIPMLRDGELLGAIVVGWVEAGPVPKPQEELLKTFADQAVIAIENARLLNELRESLQRQTATTDVLKVISRSTFDLQTVLNTLLESAARLCHADRSAIRLLKDDMFHHVAGFGIDEGHRERMGRDPVKKDGKSIAGRVAIEGKSVQLVDAQADPDPGTARRSRSANIRTMLGVPLQRERVLMGVLLLQRGVVQPFTEKEIELAETFADQAGIAIENTRLLNELRESLEQQTATSEVLQVISRSSGELHPVFQTVLENAVRICGAKFGILFLTEDDGFRTTAMHDVPRAFAEKRERGAFVRPPAASPLGRVKRTRQVAHVADITAEQGYAQSEPLRDLADLGGARTAVCVPMLNHEELIGAITIYHKEVRLFTDKQIEVVTNFASQAVIAIENARLLNELRQRTDDLTEALEHQTATSEVLNVISNSLTDTQPVFEAIVRSGLKLFGDAAVAILIPRSDKAVAEAIADADPTRAEALWRRLPIPLTREFMASRAIIDGRIVDVPDVDDPPADLAPGARNFRASGFRAVTIVPMMRSGSAIGSLMIARVVPGSLSNKQLAVLQTFANQAVIAIENTRLLNELRESLDRQTAASEVLSVISSSPGELQPVFETIGARAEKLCGAEISVVSMVDGELIRLVSINGVTRDGVEAVRQAFPMRRDEETITARAIRSCTVCHVSDVLRDANYQNKGTARVSGYRGCLAVPMVRDEQVVGAIFVARKEPGLFADSQVELLKTFAEQAVIAIENVRLFNETKEALEQQTATADVLKAISRSTFDLETVLDTLLESATRLCEGHMSWIFRRDGEILRWAASYGHTAEVHAKIRDYFKPLEVPVDRGSVVGRAALEAAVINIPDVLAEPEYKWGEAQKIGGYRASLGAPLMREGKVVGVLFVAKNIPQRFTDNQVELVKTFADQAVIAIENTRLLSELRESLQQQTATADVLKVISRSTFDLQTVLQTLVKSAARLCDADKTIITRQKNGVFYRAEAYGFSPEFLDYVRNIPIQPERGSGFGRALLEGRAVHIRDVKADPDYTLVEGQRLGDYRTVLTVPMLREGVPTGVLSLTRSEVRPFTDRQIELASTFADQAAIAIENVRLFESVEARTRELGKSLDDLRTAQDRLVQTEKLASLGQLTAGIAHEIKNPLNFVNNFSAVSVELIDELREALAGANLDARLRGEISELADMLQGNLDKVVQHGKRADSIVKNMLLHSRAGSGEHRPVDINALVEESLNLAYHGARAEKQGFNITMEKSLDPAAGEVDLFPQEITRVLLNLISNGFYAATRRKADGNGGEGYEPILATATRNLGDRVEIRIRDNGTGIPPEVKEKMFNPFFTTKPAGEGTGLGLSISHDIIVKQHGGSIEVDTKPGQYTEFTIILPRLAATIAPSGDRP